MPDSSRGRSKRASLDWQRWPKVKSHSTDKGAIHNSIFFDEGSLQIRTSVFFYVRIHIGTCMCWEEYTYWGLYVLSIRLPYNLASLLQLYDISCANFGIYQLNVFRSQPIICDVGSALKLCPKWANALTYHVIVVLVAVASSLSSVNDAVYSWIMTTTTHQ